MARLRVKATPGAREDAIIGWQGDVLRVRVRAAPEGGKANEAVRRVLAYALSVPPSAVSIVRGGASREKLVQVDGLNTEALRSRLVAHYGETSVSER